MSADGSPLGDRAAGLRTARVPYVHARVVLAERPTSAKPGDEALVLAGWHDRGIRRRHVRRIDRARTGLGAASTPASRCCSGSPPSRSRRRRASWWCTTRACPAARSRSSSSRSCRRRGWWCSATPRWPAPCAPSRSTSDGMFPPPTSTLTSVVTRPGSESTCRRWSSRATAATRRSRSTAALLAEVPYVGLVASRKRGEAVLASLEVDGAAARRVHTPAGLDIGARSSGEVALSIMAEIVSIRPRPSGRALADITTSTRDRHRPGVRDVGRHRRVVAPPRP